MKELHIDIETRSRVDLSKCGLYRYADDKDFKILLFAYSVDGSPVEVIDVINNEKIPDDILAALTDNTILKWAHNAQFERICLSKHIGLPCGKYIDPSSWRCSMVLASYLSLPPSLEGAGKILDLEEQKMAEGKKLIKKFCVPDKNGKFTACTGADWELFKRYNKRDVETEMGIISRLAPFDKYSNLWNEYTNNERVNDNGVYIDAEMVRAAVDMDTKSKAMVLHRMKALTDLDNPNSVSQLKEWLSENGTETDTLGKNDVKDLMKSSDGTILEVLKLRQMAAKSSIKKYEAMLNAVCSDGRVHGLFQFYGASRTGRFSSKLVQLQNLPQNKLPDLADARYFVKDNNLQAVEMIFGDVSDTLSQLIRTAFIPAKGKKFIVADFSAIEARVIAWLANETWRIETFRKDEDIYCASAHKMFGVPVVKHGENGHLRQQGKVAELACGYGGGVGALKAFGADKMGLTESKMQSIVSDWREASPNIVSFWWAVDSAAKKAIKCHSTEKTHGIRFYCNGAFLFITLPSGRRLTYVQPYITENQFGGESIGYMGIGTSRKWMSLETYGPKLVENIVQATARDILCFSIKNLSELGYKIVMHIHDECVVETDKSIPVDVICDVMGKAPPWAEDLPLKAAGYECEFYMKD